MHGMEKSIQWRVLVSLAKVRKQGTLSSIPGGQPGLLFLFFFPSSNWLINVDGMKESVMQFSCYQHRHE